MSCKDTVPTLREAAERALSILNSLPTDCGDGAHRDDGACCYRLGADRPAREMLHNALKGGN
jgi:hypothetical protein